jgi:hypothetical protein
MTEEEVEQYRAATAHLNDSVSTINPNPSVGNFGDDYNDNSYDQINEAVEDADEAPEPVPEDEDAVVVVEPKKPVHVSAFSRATPILKCVAGLICTVLFPDMFRLVPVA